MRMEIQVKAQTSDQRALGPHVLAVDDDPLIRAMVSDYLGKHDVRVTVVEDGRAMNEVLAREVVDLIVLDLRLPNTPGVDLVRSIRRIDGGLAFVSTAQRHPVTPLLEVRVQIVDAAQSIAHLTLPHGYDECRRLRALVAVRLEG